MLRFVAALKFIRLLKKVKGFGTVTPDNWPEYKALIIECLRLECKADTNCSDNILYWNMLATYRRNQDKFINTMPVEYQTDLFVTLRELSRKHHPEIWAMIDKMHNNPKT